MDTMDSLRRKPFLKCLVDLVSEALSHSLLDEGEELIGALRQLRPDFDALDHIEAWFAIKRGNASDALRLAQRVVDQHGEWVPGLCQLAICKRITGDPGWRQEAQTAFSMPSDADTIEMLGSMLGLDPEEILARHAQALGPIPPLPAMDQLTAMRA